MDVNETCRKNANDKNAIIKHFVIRFFLATINKSYQLCKLFKRTDNSNSINPLILVIMPWLAPVPFFKVSKYKKVGNGSQLRIEYCFRWRSINVVH